MKFDAHQFWVPSVPDCWNWNRVSESFDVVNGFPFDSGSFNSIGNGLPLVRIRDILSPAFTTFYGGRNGLEVVVKNGDIVIGMDGDFNSCWWMNGNALLNQRVAALRSKSNPQVDSRFAFYQVPFGLKVINDLTPSSTVKHLSSADIGALRLPAPDLPTQKKIASFLDRETARIDELIAKKERLSGVIDQRRLAVISAAVAGQIGPAKAETPEQGAAKHQVRLRFMLQVAPSAREIQNLAAEDVVTFAPMDALNNGLGGMDASISRPLSEVTAGSYNYFRDGDVLLAKVTPCFENGKKALAKGLINGVGFATSEVHVFRPKPGRLDARFLVYLFSSQDFKSEGMKSMTGSGGLKRVSDAAILNYRPNIVNYELQKQVSDFLDREMGVFEVIKNRTKVSIDRLREYRAALITAAVTGQIDVDTYGKADNVSAKLDKIEEDMQA